MHLKLKCKGSYKMAVLCCSAIPEEKYYIKKTAFKHLVPIVCVCVLFFIRRLFPLPTPPRKENQAKYLLKNKRRARRGQRAVVFVV